MEEHTPAEPHWYLQLLATHPDYGGRGVEVRSEWDVPTGPHIWGMYRPAT